MQRHPLLCSNQNSKLPLGDLYYAQGPAVLDYVSMHIVYNISILPHHNNTLGSMNVKRIRKQQR